MLAPEKNGASKSATEPRLVIIGREDCRGCLIVKEKLAGIKETFWSKGTRVEYLMFRDVREMSSSLPQDLRDRVRWTPYFLAMTGDDYKGGKVIQPHDMEDFSPSSVLQAFLSVVGQLRTREQEVTLLIPTDPINIVFDSTNLYFE